MSHRTCCSHTAERAATLLPQWCHDHPYTPDTDIYRAARDALRTWLDVRPDCPGVDESAALWLNCRGWRLYVRSINTVVREIATPAGLVHDAGPEAGKARMHPHTLRHTFGTQLLRNGVDVVTVADLTGHAKLDPTRINTRSSAAAVMLGEGVVVRRRLWLGDD